MLVIPSQEEDEELKARLVDNAKTMNKMTDLRNQLQSLSMAKKEKVGIPICLVCMRFGCKSSTISAQEPESASKWETAHCRRLWEAEPEQEWKEGCSVGAQQAIGG